MDVALISKKRTTSPLLIVKKLQCWRHTRPVTSLLNFSLKKENVLWIRGENGSGKSTLLRCLLNLNPSWDGEIRWNLMSDQEVHYLGYENGLREGLSVQEWASVENFEPSSLLIPFLARWGMLPFWEEKIRFLSAGQKRRLALVRLFLKTKPKDVWVLDEPTHSLDEEGSGLFLDALTDHLQKEGAALVVTHDPLCWGFSEEVSQTLFLTSSQKKKA